VRIETDFDPFTVDTRLAVVCPELFVETLGCVSVPPDVLKVTA
jgi:hypothetical protein